MKAMLQLLLVLVDDKSVLNDGGIPSEDCTNPNPKRLKIESCFRLALLSRKMALEVFSKGSTKGLDTSSVPSEDHILIL